MYALTVCVLMCVCVLVCVCVCVLVCVWVSPRCEDFIAVLSAQQRVLIDAQAQLLRHPSSTPR